MLGYLSFFQYNSFTRKLIQLLDIDDDTLLNISPLINTPSTDRYVAIQQRQHIVDILLQKMEVRFYFIELIIQFYF